MPRRDLASICTNAALRRASRNVGRLYDEALAPTGLRATQFGLLAQIAAFGRPTMRELAGEMVMDLSALGHTLKPLVRDGLVRIAADGRDRRVRRVELTTRGAVAFDGARPLWRAAQRRLDEIVGRDQAIATRAALIALASPSFAARFEEGA